MKLKTRLVISFLIMIILPFIIMAVIFFLAVAFNPQISFTVSDFDKLLNADAHDFYASVSIALVLSAIVLIGWIYQGFMSKIHKLIKASEQIREGNLNYTVADSGTDELSDLCNSFEDMRLRLLDNAKSRLDSEEEQKQLISNVAHDLKTPITSIKGYAEGLLDGVANTPEKQEAYIRTILNKAEDMNELINELTLYSQIDANNIPYNFDRLKVQTFFNDCASEIGMDLSNQNIKLDYVNLVEPSVEIIADAEQLGRVISNIVSNSVKYMGEKEGHISLVVKDVGDFIQASIEDNGIGISPSDMPYIFDRTFRSDTSRRSTTGGSGLGLSIAKKIIDDHNGKIWATSVEGEGTTMTFVIRKYFSEV